MRRSFFGHRGGRRPWFLWKALAIVVGIAAVGGVVMLLWNWLMPALFTTAAPIDYWRALGLLLLCKILFGGGGRGHWHGRRHHLENMTPDERAQFKEHFKSRWGRRFGPGMDEGCPSSPRSSSSNPAPGNDTAAGGGQAT